MPTLSFELIVLATLVVLLLCVWRFTSIIRELAQSTGRHDERNAAQRDRFFMQLLENQSVASNADKAVQMASVHSAESLRAHGMNLSRDAAGEADVKSARKAEQERKHRDRQSAVSATVPEGFSQ